MAPDARTDDEAAYARLLAALPSLAADRVRTAMAEPARRYHASWHLGRIRRLHAEHGPREWDDDVALLAAYHDAVYDPAAPPTRNEYRSAAMFLEDAAALAVAPSRAARLAAVILATADHLGDGAAMTAADPLGAWFLDLDLEPLASPDHAANTALIRAEYAHVPDAAFAAGRRAFLARLAAHPRLFRTDTAARSGWEESARGNIAADLA